MSNCVVGSGGSRLPCSTIAEHSVEGCDHFSHDGDGLSKKCKVL